ncbi:MAG: ferritin-like domain-containing protein [Alphaproteobacteria bacterium]|nr:ferritin-like domain-containing protein [Alphaproteobacteria bacterium]
MESTAGLPDTKSGMIVNLISMERDVISAYDNAIARMRNTPHSEKLRTIRSNHCQHITDLARTARKVGADIPDRNWQPHKASNDTAFDDAVLLETIARNMNDAFAAYRTALGNAIIDGALRETCKSALYDERRHRQWLSEVLVANR